MCGRSFDRFFCVTFYFNDPFVILIRSVETPASAKIIGAAAPGLNHIVQRGAFGTELVIKRPSTRKATTPKASEVLTTSRTKEDIERSLTPEVLASKGA